MSGRVLLLSACAALLSGAQCQDTFERPNEDTECGTEAVDFLAYGESLGLACGVEQCEYTEEAGTLFDIKYRKDYKVIEYTTSPELEQTPMNSATYILYQCGQEEPNDEWIQTKVQANTSDIHFLEIPLTAVATEDSTVGWMLEELDLMDRVRFAGPFSTSPCMQKVAAAVNETGCGRPFIGEYSSEPENTNVTEIDANFGFASDVDAKQVYMQASADPGPLARAEHIIYMSAFFNVEAKAMEYYKNVSDAYTDQSTNATDAAAPTVAWLTTHEDALFSYLFTEDGEALGPGIAAVVSFARYKTLLTRDAGGAVPSQAAVLNTTGAFASNDDIIFAESEYASKADALAALQEALKGVDVLIDETYHFDVINVNVAGLTAFLGLDGSDVSAVDFPFLANESIWRHDKAQSASGSDDWFGEAVARPDFVHSDLKEVITPGSLPNHTFKFFRNLSKGDPVRLTDSGQCTNFTCNSYDEQKPLTVSLPEETSNPVVGSPPVDGPVVVSPPVDTPSSAGQALVSGAVTAGAMIAAML